MGRIAEKFEYYKNLDEEDFKEFIKTLNVQPDGTINNEGNSKKNLIFNF